MAADRCVALGVHLGCAPPAALCVAVGQLWVNIMNLALIHSTVCRDLLDKGELADAVRYCVAQGVEPPVPACSELPDDDERCVARAKETLSDYGWWEKRLKVRDARFRLQESRESLEASQTADRDRT